jgi:hypothetical protein
MVGRLPQAWRYEAAKSGTFEAPGGVKAYVSLPLNAEVFRSTPYEVTSRTLAARSVGPEHPSKLDGAARGLPCRRTSFAKRAIRARLAIMLGRSYPER